MIGSLEMRIGAIKEENHLESVLFGMLPLNEDTVISQTYMLWQNTSCICLSFLSLENGFHLSTYLMDVWDFPSFFPLIVAFSLIFCWTWMEELSLVFPVIHLSIILHFFCTISSSSPQRMINSVFKMCNGHTYKYFAVKAKGKITLCSHLV